MFTVVQLFQRASRFVEYRLQNRQTFHLVLKHCQPHRNLIPSLHCTPYTGQQISSNLYKTDTGQQISNNLYKIVHTLDNNNTKDKYFQNRAPKIPGFILRFSGFVSEGKANS